MKLPYGISNFQILRSEPYYYADRTSYIERLESLGERYIMFLRPRRFGKSLFLSMLQHYYSIENKVQFPELFGPTYIGQTPTPEANTYKILRFDFSGIETSSEDKLLQGFLGSVTVGIQSFIRKYTTLSTEVQETILAQTTPAEMIKRFFDTFQKEPIYLLVDEYDHFANEILARDYDQFLQFVAHDGFVRKFYEVIKVATGEGVVRRMFIMGVTPITMDSLTSGFNIVSNLSTNSDFNEMLGFTQTEVSELIKTESVLTDMKRWYNGYRFHPSCEERIYNPDMVLYFAKTFLSKGTYPENMIDTNIASDYGKIRRLFQIKNPEQNYEVLEQLIKEGSVQSKLTAQFSFEKDFERQDFISLLFYLGFISIEENVLNRLRFSVPNHVIQRLYWDYFFILIHQRTQLGFSTDELEEAVLELAQENRITPFLSFIESTLQTLSNRDTVNFDEKYIKALFVGFVNLANIYFIKSEMEVQKKYPDIMLLYRKPILPNYQFIVELKYLKKSEASQLKSKVQEAEKQLRGYLQSPEIQALSSLKAWSIVFIGDQIGQVVEISVR